jgi:bifunctional non-homologous end joining protein LigD
MPTTVVKPDPGARAAKKKSSAKEPAAKKSSARGGARRAAKPGATKSDATKRRATKADATKRRATKPVATKREAVKAGPTKRGATKVGAATRGAKSGAGARSRTVAKSHVSRPAAAKTLRSPRDKLAKYRSMRDFEVTAEPSGGPAPRDGHSFVIQKHAASHLHYDFRLEHAGVLLSWSVPKGPSLRAGDRRLAVRTEDHPREYADFEGIIPKGEYGGGTVIVWDRGEWQPDGDPQKGLDKGHLKFDLKGHKLNGRYHLVRTRGYGKHDEKREHWLLFKGNDASADAKSDIVLERPESVISGRTVEEVAAAPSRVWHSNRSAKEQTAAAPSKAPRNTRTRKAASSAEAGPQAAASRKTGRTSEVATATTTEVGRSDVASVVKRLPLPFALTSLDKVLYPERNLRKADLVAYYAAVSSFALPHLGGRPLTLVRCPNGRAGKCFFQKHVSDAVPSVVQRVNVSGPGDSKGEVEEYMAVRDLPGLVALSQMGVLEVHTWACHIDQLERPDQFVFDLDPDEGLGWDAVVEAAFLVRDRLADLELTSFVKTTGGKGLHVVVPVARKLDWDQHYAFSRAFAESIARAQPSRYLTNMRKALRKGKLFVDYMRNGRGSTAIAPYSTRAREGCTVATPISWDELAAGVDPRKFDLYSVIQRLDGQHDDPWRAYATTKQAIRAAALRQLGVRA